MQDMPNLQSSSIQSSIDPDNAASPTIRFHHYQYPTKCTIHGVLPLDEKRCNACEQKEKIKKKIGKVQKRRHLTLLSRKVGVFMNDFYLPLLEAYAFHQPHVSIFSKKGCRNL
jgi:hypothetical protein